MENKGETFFAQLNGYKICISFFHNILHFSTLHDLEYLLIYVNKKNQFIFEDTGIIHPRFVLFQFQKLLWKINLSCFTGALTFSFPG